MNKPEIIKKGKLTYLFYADKIIVGQNIPNGQWLSYDRYSNWSRQGLTMFREEIKKSEDEYGTFADQMSLAVQCEIKGVRTPRPKEVDDE